MNDPLPPPISASVDFPEKSLASRTAVASCCVRSAVGDAMEGREEEATKEEEEEDPFDDWRQPTPDVRISLSGQLNL